jgi:adenine/guanine phosphoribosyltransferase-like PRPP-binding protein
MDLKQHIRSIPDFPKPGILFYDISTLLAHPLGARRSNASPKRCSRTGPIS